MSSLTQEVIVEILTFLPVKSLLRFKSVCKSWYSLISSTEFAKSHLRRVVQADNISRCSRVLLPCLPAAKCFDFEAASGMENNQAITRPNHHDMVLFPDTITTMNFPDAILFRGQRYVEILGSCNGLVCLSNEKNSVIFWNPSTRVSKILSKHSSPRSDFSLWLPRRCVAHRDVTFSGLGYDKSTDDYKLIVGHKEASDSKHFVAQSIEILTLKSNCWRKIEYQEDVTIVNTGVYLDKFVHWIGWRKSRFKGEIVSFDLTEEKFKNVLPFSEEIRNKVSVILSLGLLRNRLCLLFERRDIRFEAWVVEGLGANSTWTNLFVAPKFYAIPLGLTNKGEFVFDYCSSLGLYDPSKRFRYSFHGQHDACEARVYLETLVSPHY